MLLCDTEMPQVTKGFRSTSLTLTPCSLLTNSPTFVPFVTDLSLTDKKSLMLSGHIQNKQLMEGFWSPCVWGTQGAGGEGSH